MDLLDFAKWLNSSEVGWGNVAYIWTCNDRSLRFRFPDTSGISLRK